MDRVELLLERPGWLADERARRWAWAPLPDFARTVLDSGFEDLASIPGQWVLVEERADRVIVATDRMRSLGLLYARVGSRWIVADDVEAMRSRLPDWRLDASQAAVFAHFGYALGDGTLIDGVRACEAASVVALHDDGTSSSTLFARYRRNDDLIESPEEFAEEFTRALDGALARLLEASGSRPLVIPLSGGLDSRLLLARLRALGADRLTAFTYGKAGSRETAISRSVAESLGVPWIGIECVVDEMRRLWTGPEGEAFRRSNWCGVSLPHVQDWFALHHLRSDGLVGDDAVFLPGHTIVGNSHDEEEVLAGMPAAALGRLIADHHGVLQGRPRSIDTDPLVVGAVERAAREVEYDGSPAASMSWLEWFNLRERQAKYINHSMRAYESFGFTWAAPMLDAQLWRVWLSGDLALTKNRQWYAAYVSDVYSTATGAHDEVPSLYSTSNDHGLPAGLKAAALGLMRATRADRALSKARSIRTMLDHPMAFEAFAAPLNRVEQARAFAMGASSTGLWARLFLANSWGSNALIVPEDEGARAN